MKRVGLLAGLLVLVLAVVAMAEDATPVPSPWSAPDDLESVLPPMIAGIEADITVAEVGYFQSHEVFADPWRDVLVPLGKDPMDVREAFAWAEDDSGSVFIGMTVIDGVQAIDVIDDVWTAVHTGPGVVTDVTWDWKDIDGRRVATVDFVTDWDGIAVDETEYLYPKGEALFTIVTEAYEDNQPISIEEVLAELP